MDKKAVLKKALATKSKTYIKAKKNAPVPSKDKVPVDAAEAKPSIANFWKSKGKK